MAPQILIFGLPRTGTQSLLDALDILGFPKGYHMRVVESNGNINDWITLLDQKYGGESAPAVDLETLRGVVDGFDATADFPTSIFCAELIQLYADAKIILTPRDEDAWIRSMESTLIYNHTRPDANVDRPMRPLAEKYHEYCWKNDFAKHGREFYRAYLQDVRKLTEGREVLEYRPGDGWGALCGFLGRSVPQVEFPRSDDLAYLKHRT